MTELLAVLVARGEEREVGVEELLGELVADRDAVEQREHAGAPFAVGSRSQTGGSPSGTCTWSRENGR